MRIGLTYDLQTDPADPRQAEFDPPATLDALSGALEALGHQPLRLGGAHDLLVHPGRLRDVEIVFNLAEGREGRCREAWVPTLLELHGVPYVGSDPLTLSLGLDKVMTKRLLEADGIPTPRWISVAHPRDLPPTIPLRMPVIVKPRWEGSGRGINADAIVRTRETLAARVEWLVAHCTQPVLIEEFLPGGELTVCLIGNGPPTAYPAIQRPLDPVTRLSCHVSPSAPGRTPAWDCPLELEASLDAQAGRLARRLFERLGCRDIARVDLRVDADGRLAVLEINPLPSFDPDGNLGLLAEYLGISYPGLIGRVLEAALARLGRTGSIPLQVTR